MDSYLCANFQLMDKVHQFANGSINYRSTGSGKTVVLLHGFLEDLSIWNKFSEALSENYRVISIDLPGFGKSSVFDDIHTMEFMAEGVHAILEVEKIDSCVMVGHSMGGYVALAFAKTFKEKLKGLVLFHSQAAADDEQGRMNRDRTIAIVNSDHGHFIHGFIPSLFCETRVGEYENEIDDLRKTSMKTASKGITAALAGMRDRKDSLEFLSKIQIPVFFIIGKNDPKMPLAKIMDQVSVPPNSEALIIDKVGHMGFIESGDLTYSALEHFIERNS